MTTQLPRPLINQILHHAQVHPETEVCGLVASRNGLADQVYPVANASAQPQRLFEMEPHAQIEAMRTMRESDQQLFAIYHSHPHAPAEPSIADLQQAAYPEALYLIVSLNTQGVLEMRGYRLADNAVQEVDLETVETDAP